MIVDSKTLAKATFAGGCFWCMQPPFDNLPGVISTSTGYTGGHKENPTYEEVCSGKSGHTEGLQVTFSPQKVSYPQLLDVFRRNINPADSDGQFVDRGSQYRPAIFYHNQEQQQLAEKSQEDLAASRRFKRPPAIEIIPLETFYPAENYHHDYYRKSPAQYKAYRYNSGRDQFLKNFWESKD